MIAHANAYSWMATGVSTRDLSLQWGTALSPLVTAIPVHDLNWIPARKWRTEAAWTEFKEWINLYLRRWGPMQTAKHSVPRFSWYACLNIVEGWVGIGRDGKADAIDDPICIRHFGLNACPGRACTQIRAALKPQYGSGALALAQAGEDQH